MDVHPPPDKTIILVLVAVVLLILSMIFSSAESAFLSVNRLRVRFLCEKKHPTALLTAKLLSNKDRLINTLLVANNIVNIALSAIITFITVETMGEVGVAFATLIVTVALLIFSEITPKTIASRHPEPVAFALSRFIFFLEIILSPLIYIFTFISRILLFLFGVKEKKQKASFTEEEIKTFIDVGQESGILEDNEKRLMHSVFKFTDLLAKDIMIPRRKIIAVKVNITYNEVISLARRTKLSRFPVYRGDIDHIEGLLYLKDLFLIKDTNNFDATKFMRPPLFILGTKKMSSIQQVLKDNRQSMAVVVDEYSGTEGILTSEDIQKEIFGTITDDTFLIEEEEIETLQEIPGTTRLLDIEDSLKIKFDTDDCETIGGFIAKALDRIPEKGDTIKYSGFIFTVQSMERFMVGRVLISEEQISENDNF